MFEFKCETDMWCVLVATLLCAQIISAESSVSSGRGVADVSHLVTKRSIPTTQCDKSTEGNSHYNSSQTDTVWICQRGTWIPYKLTLSLGTTRDFPGTSCKHILEFLNATCNQTQIDGPYWISLRDECPRKEQTIQVWCDMSTCGGGWSLVWKHSYMEVTPLTSDMYYFSDHYRPCTDINSGWCNVPYKSRLNATEMMIVAYHNKRVVYAYRGRFNRNIDLDWTGGILLDHHKCVDHCTRSESNGIRPAPSNDFNQDNRLLGIAFDKRSPDNYYHNCDTFRRNYDKPLDCRWYDCHLPTSISATNRGIQMTVAIYVR